MSSTFDEAAPYSSNIPSFGGAWGFSMGWDSGGSGADWKVESTTSIDSALDSQIEGGEAGLKYYDGVTHKGMFGLPKSVRRSIAKEKRVITKENPVFMY